MYSNKLVRLLGGITKQELRTFEKHLKCYHGNFKIAIALFDYLKVLHPKMDDPKIQKTRVLEKISLLDSQNPGKQILNEASRLYKWLEDFLLYERIKERGNPIRERMLAEIFKEKQLYHLFHLKVNRALSIYEEEVPRNNWEILEALYLQHLLYYSQLPEGLIIRDQEFLRSIIGKLDLFYTSAKLQYGCEMINRTNLLRESSSIWLWQAIKEDQDDTFGAKGVLLKGFRLAANVLERQQLEDYQALKSFYIDHHHLFSPEVQQILNGYLVNYAAKRIKQSDLDWVDEVFKWYDFGMASRLFFEHGLISSTRFINMVNVGCAQGKLQWAEGFIEEWHHYLPSEHGEVTRLVAQALVKFERGQFGDVLRILTNCKNKNPFLELRIRTLQLMSFVEEGEDVNFILDYCKNFQAYLRRNEIVSKDTIKGFLNFSIVLSKMLRKTGQEKQILAEVNSLKPIFCKRWLTGQLMGGETA